MRKLLVCDLDGTLLGHRRSLIAFTKWWKKHCDEFILVYATGRILSEVKELVCFHRPPLPHIIIAEMGTAIWYCYLRSKSIWPSKHAESWNRHSVRKYLSQLVELTEQPSKYQTEYKLSYYAEGLDREFLKDIEEGLIEKGLQVDLVYSYNQFLDVLPSGINKGTAVEKVRKDYVSLGVGLPPEHVIVAGDSGNDLGMFNKGFKGIVVSNAQPELREVRGQDIYHSPFPFANGVLDGIDYWER